MNSSNTMEKNECALFKVGSESNVHKVSEAIYKSYLEGANLEIQAVGGGAVNQAVKSLAIARSKLALAGKDIAVIIGFRDISNSKKVGETISAVNFTLVNLRYESRR